MKFAVACLVASVAAIKIRDTCSDESNTSRTCATATSKPSNDHTAHSTVSNCWCKATGNLAQDACSDQSNSTRDCATASSKPSDDHTALSGHTNCWCKAKPPPQPA